MRLKGLLFFLLLPAITNAACLNLRPVVALTGGWANERASVTQSFTDVDSNLFQYNGMNSWQSVGLGGFFVGAQTPTPCSRLILQGGLEYLQYGFVTVNSTNSVGIEPDTTTAYNYKYRLQARQLLVSTKWMTQLRERFFPYAFLGIGAAFNTMNNFNVSTTETGSINLSPTFRNNSNTNFTYSVGVGIDTAISKHVLLGLGYRFTDLGQASLGKGKVKLNSYQASVPFTFNVPHVYSNQVLAQLSYLF